MGEIYATAKCVIIWIGEADEHSKIALPILGHLWDDVVDADALTAKFPTYLTFNDPRFYEDIKRQPLTIPQWEAIAQFFTRRWFQRMWILQESVFAKDACILCGEEAWRWGNVLLFALFLYQSAWGQNLRQIHWKNSPKVPLGNETLVSIQRLSYCRAEGPNRPALLRMLNTWTAIDSEESKLCAFLGYLIDQTRRLSASDPRDKIYAILPLATWYLRGQDCGSVPALPAPDYAKPVSHVFRQFTEYLLQHSNGLFILSWCDDFQRRRLKDELPSWVPDFSTEMLPLPLIGVKPFNATPGWNYIPRESLKQSLAVDLLTTSTSNN